MMSNVHLHRVDSNTASIFSEAFLPPFETVGSDLFLQQPMRSFPALLAGRTARIEAPPFDPFALVNRDVVIGFIRELSDDQYRGRDSPSLGLDAAGRYITEQARGAGLVGANPANAADPYAQPFDLYGFVGAALPLAMQPGPRRIPSEAYQPQLFQHGVHGDEMRRRVGVGFMEPASFVREGIVANRAALLPGSDPTLKDEVILLSAHYDHIGERRWGSGDKIYNGADDNASGAAVLLTVMGVLAEMRRRGMGPKRSVLFLWTAAEEKGLIGADYYRRHPLVPMEKTVGAINVDMIARQSAERLSACTIDAKRHPTAWDRLVDGAAKRAGFAGVDRNIDQYLRRQDGWIWTSAGIPTLFLFEGFDAEGNLNPDYHGVDDEVDRIVAENGGVKAERVAKMVLGLILASANQ